MNDKFKIQDDQYSFPYHYLPHFDSSGVPIISRELTWGWDYLTYMDYTINYINNNIRSGNSILDVGCGDGYLLNNIENPNIKKLGIDLSSNAIQFANAFNKNGQFIVKSVDSVTDEFDMIVLNEVMEHIPDDEIFKFMNNSIRLLKSKGQLIITVPSDDIPVNKKHYRHYNLKLIIKHIDNDQLKLIHHVKLYKVSKKLERMQWLINNRNYQLKNKYLIKKVWEWHKANTYQTKNQKARHYFAVFSKVD